MVTVMEMRFEQKQTMVGLNQSSTPLRSTDVYTAVQTA